MRCSATRDAGSSAMADGRPSAEPLLNGRFRANPVSLQGRSATLLSNVKTVHLAAVIEPDGLPGLFADPPIPETTAVEKIPQNTAEIC